jgi:hypothetical protein
MHPIEHFCCQNLKCADHGIRGKENLRFEGWSGKGRRIHMLYCRTCKAHFSERKGTILEHSKLPVEKVVSVLDHLRDGNGTRGTSRLTGIDKDTVTRYVQLAGEHARKLHDELVAFSPQTKEVQYDEKWSFVGKKRSALHTPRKFVR